MNADDYAARHFCILTRLSPFAVSEWPHIRTRQVASTQVSYSLNISKCQMFYQDEEKEKKDVTRCTTLLLRFVMQHNAMQ